MFCGLLSAAAVSTACVQSPELVCRSLTAVGSREQQKLAWGSASSGEQIGSAAGAAQQPVLGMAAVTAACLLSGLAGVWLERIVKLSLIHI